jgi:hypothetical protein
MKKSYQELLKDPRWQKKRLEILGEQEFSCENCGDNKSTLHVHHGTYLKGKKPWEYPDELLHVLCETCHSEIEKCKEEVNHLLGTLSVCDFDSIRGILLAHSSRSDEEIIKNISFSVFCFCHLMGLEENALMPIIIHMKRKQIMMSKLLDRINELSPSSDCD